MAATESTIPCLSALDAEPEELAPYDDLARFIVEALSTWGDGVVNVTSPVFRDGSRLWTFRVIPPA